MQISVVIPLYNKRESVGRALESVFAQTVQPLEIIIINDGSTDGSEKLVDELQHPLIRLIHQTNAGVSVARNNGIEKAQGEWIAFLDADDEWNVDQLEVYHYLINKNPQAKLVATSYQLGDVHGNRISIKLLKLKLSDSGLLKNYFEVAACSAPPVWTSAVCLQKESILSIGGFPAGIKTGEDLLTWARMILKFPLAYSMYEGAIYWQDIANLQARIPDPNDKVGEYLRELLLQTQKPLTTQIKKYIAHWYKMRASIYLRMGSSKVYREIFRSLYYDHFNYKLYFYLLLLLFPLKYRNRIFQFFTNK